MKPAMLPRPGPRRLVPLLPVLLGVVVAMTIGYVFRSTIWDYMQHGSDAAYFFETASTGDYDFSLDESLLFAENQIPLILYGSVYALMSSLGLDANPFGGIFVNAAMMIAAIALALHYARTRFGFGPRRQLKLAGLLSFNGLIMMFVGIHMRDAFLFFLTTAAVVAFHPSPGRTPLPRHAARFCMLVLLAVLSFLSRKESFAVPILVYILAFVSTLDFRRAGIRLALLACAAAVATVIVRFNAIELVTDNAEAYKLLSQEESSGSSLAYYLLYDLPPPFSTLAGMVLLLFIKVPFWRGALYDSYSFYMSLAALQMLFIAPTVIGLGWFALRNRVELRHRYLFFILAAMAFIVTLTSNQVRHFATVYSALMIVYLCRDEIVPWARLRIFWQFSLATTALVILASLAVEIR